MYRRNGEVVEAMAKVTSTLLKSQKSKVDSPTQSETFKNCGKVPKFSHSSSKCSMRK